MNNYSPETYFDTIDKYVNKLSPDWFSAKKKEFESNRAYQPQYNEIVVIDNSWSWGEEYEDLQNEDSNNKGEFEEKEYFFHSISLAEYCYGLFKEDNPFIEFDFDSQKLHSVCTTVDEFTAGLLEFIDSKDLNLIRRFIDKTLHEIEVRIEKLKKALDEGKDKDIYELVLNDFSRYVYFSFTKKYEKQIAFASIIEHYQDKLDFDLSVDELVSLLYILAKANILKVESEYNTHFLPFCVNHFTTTKKGERVNVASYKSFDNAYRKIFAENNGKGLEKIKRKLDPILKDIMITK